MMRTGMPMREVDNTDLAMYLQVLAHMARRARGEHGDPPAAEKPDSKKPQVIELRRGYIDEFFR